MTRVLLVVVCVVAVALALLAMRAGWRHRAARQPRLPDLAGPPAELGEALLRASGLYVGTTYASSWQDRIVQQGLGVRAEADADLHAAGLVLHRRGATTIFIPSSAWVQARLAPGLAGKVLGEGGLLALRWRLGDTEVDTGFRADDKATYPSWVDAINERIPA